jgi:hypothetical protein
MNTTDANQTVPSQDEHRRRDDSGLTTLEWLLIVAAVAGLAALAVVLVTNVVGDTSEQISGQSARLTAARVAADNVTRAARDETDPGNKEEFDPINLEHRTDCNQIRVIYGDIEDIQVLWVKNTAVATGSEDDGKTPPADTSSPSDFNDWDPATIGCHVHVPS